MAPRIHRHRPNRLHNIHVQVVFETAKLGNVNKLKTLLEKRRININHRDCSGRTALMWAVENDLPAAVETLIEAGADVNQTRSIKKHLTPVMVAAEKGYTKVLRLLTSSGADVNDHRFDKETPVMLAVRNSRDCLEVLAHSGADVNTPDRWKNTPLTVAVARGCLDYVNCLIRAGADCNYLSPDGTPVMIAVKNNDIACLQVLVKNGADVNTPARWKNTPLTLAVEKGHLDCVNCLIQAGADYNYMSIGGSPVMIAIKNNNCDILQTLVDNGADVNSADTGNNTPLTLAVNKGRLGFVTSLIEAGADCNYQSPVGTPVIIAVKSNYFDILQALVDNGGEVNTPDRWNNTPLTLAVNKGHLGFVTSLIEAGADCNYQSPVGTPAMIAIKSNNRRCLRVLTENGADVNTSDRWGNTPLTLAIQKDCLASVKTLISGGADLNLRSPKGPPLYTAYSLRKLEVAELLLQGGANVDIANSTGHTLLMLAAIRHKEKWVQTLIQAGANANLVSSNGRTVFIMAIRRRHTFRESFAMVGLPRQTGGSRNTKNKECVNKFCDRCKWHHMQAARLKSLLFRKHDWESRCPLTVGKYCKCCHPLLEHSTTVNIQDNNGKTALMYCVETNNSYCAKLLLDNKADPNIRDNYGKTALIYCVVRDEMSLAKILLDNKAAPNIRDRYAMFMLCYRTGEVHLSELFLNNRACPNIYCFVKYCDRFAETKYRLCDKRRLDSEADPNIQDNDGKTALMYSVLNNNLHFIKLLLDNSADPNVQDTEGKTALMYCAGLSRARYGGPNYMRLCLCRLDNKADPNIQDNYGKTAMMYSVLNNNSRFTELLLDNSADPNVQDTEGKTALMHSLNNDCFDILLSKNVDTDRVDNTNSTALVYLLRILVNESVYNSDTMQRLCRLLTCGANPSIHPSHRHLLNKLCWKLCRANHMFSLKTNVQLMRMFVCNAMGSRVTETMPTAELYSRFIFDKHCRSFLRFAYYEGSVDIMHYLIATCFLTTTDLTFLRERPWSYPSVAMTELLNAAMSQPWPLVKLTFIAVSTAVGFNCDRQSRLRKTQLPPRLQRMLMFQEPVERLPVSQWEDIQFCFDPVAYEQLPKPRPLIYYWPFGRNLSV